MPGWMQVIQIVLGIITIILAYQKLQQAGIIGTPEQSSGGTGGTSGGTDPITKGKDALSGTIDWLGGHQSLNQTPIPNWLLLLGGIVFLYAIFRK